MWLRISSIVLALAACGRKSPPPPAEPDASAVHAVVIDDVQQLAAKGAAAARAAAGAVGFHAWRYAGRPAAPGRQWVAVDVAFGDLAIDPDHVELGDADGDAIAGIADVQYLDGAGNRVPASFARAKDRRYVMMFDLPTATTRVRLGAWGEWLSKDPVAIADSGPVFAEPSREVLRHWVDGDRHVVLVEDRNADDPPVVDLEWFKDVPRKACLPRGLVAVDRRLMPVAPPDDPPASIVHALYLVDFRCTQAPHVLDWGKDGAPMPAAEPLDLPDASLASLAGHAPDAVVVEMPTAGRSLVAVRRDGSLVAVAPGAALEVRLLDPITGAERARLPAPSLAPSALAFTPDGTRLVGAADGDVIVWDVASRTRIVRRLVTPPGSLLAVSPDGRTIAIDHPFDDTVAWSGRVTLLATADLSVRATLRVLPDAERSITGLGFSPDGRRLVVCADDGGTRVYASPGGKQLTAIRGPDAGARATTCAIAPDGRILTGFEDRLVISDAGGRRLASVDAGGGIYAIAVAPDGSIITGGGDGEVLRWSRDGLRSTRLARLREAIRQVLAGGELIIAVAHREVAIVAADGRVLARLPAVQWTESVAIGDGVVAISEPLTGAELARVRIWRER